MHLNTRRKSTLSKKRLPFSCRICLQSRGIIRSFGICRKCFYDYVNYTNYR